VKGELSSVVDELGEQGMADGDPPGRPAGAAKTPAIHPRLPDVGRGKRLPGAYPTSKHGSVGVGRSVSRSILEGPRGSPDAPSVTRAPAAATPTHAWIAP
jgi:hypothetical protein